MRSRQFDRLTPQGDLVCIRRLPDADREGRIWIPDTARDFKRPKYSNMFERRGEVVAVGPGDLAHEVACAECGFRETRTTHVEQRDDSGGSHTVHVMSDSCPHCRGRMTLTGRTERRSMEGLKVGDEVLYQRSPKNEVILDGIEYVFIHAEHLVDAVIERD
jgi:co-chaperonin GroES (HSP10)